MEIAEALAVYRKAEEVVAEARLLVEAARLRSAAILPPSVPHEYLAARSLLRECQALLSGAAKELTLAQKSGAP